MFEWNGTQESRDTFLKFLQSPLPQNGFVRVRPPYTSHAHPLTRRYVSRPINRWAVRAPALLVASDQDPAPHLHYCLRLPAAVTTSPRSPGPPRKPATRRIKASRRASRLEGRACGRQPRRVKRYYEYAQDGAAAAGNRRVARALITYVPTRWSPPAGQRRRRGYLDRDD